LTINAASEGPVRNISTGIYYSTIQDAIDAPETKDRHLIRVDPGTYKEMVNISKALTIWGVDEATTIIDAMKKYSYCIYSNCTEEVHIVGFTVQNAKLSGIELDSFCRQFSVENTTVKNCNAGIHFEASCSNGRLEKNTIMQCSVGLDFEESWDISVTENRVSDCTYGLYLAYCHGFVIRKNEIYNNTYNFFTYGTNITAYFNEIDTSNTVDGKPIYYFVNRENQVLTGLNVGCVGLVSCVNMTVKELNLTNNSHGILLVNTTTSTLRSNLCAKNEWGISLTLDSTDNEIYENTLLSNLEGLALGPRCSGNKIYHNSFLNNTELSAESSSINVWDDGYPSGGNFWSNYTDFDYYSGAYQNESGGDGIWDHPYPVNASNTDNYPLKFHPGTTSTFEVSYEGFNHSVSVFADSAVTGFNFNPSTQEITFMVSGGTFCNVTVPKTLLDGALTLFIDDQSTPWTLMCDEEHVYAYVTHNFTDMHQIEFIGEYMGKPPTMEFPDINGDGKINILDIAIVAKHFGEPK
jgi:parallel beta-helix repeat protein